MHSISGGLASDLTALVASSPHRTACRPPEPAPATVLFPHHLMRTAERLIPIRQYCRPSVDCEQPAPRSKPFEAQMLDNGALEFEFEFDRLLSGAIWWPWTYESS